jgi:hypothetical protein
MKKILPIVITCGALIGSIVYYDAENTYTKQQSLYINEDFIQFYEMLLDESKLSEEERIAYRESYRTFLIWSGEEYREYDPNEYLLEE